ncbi:MAG: PilZ domain-containing protein [Desulfosarcinaceae bacterium]|nr:PilZ domain-containing protein [Desulfosarcinaceae bacterium]
MEAKQSTAAAATVALQSTPAANRRRYPRLVFAPADGVTATLRFTARDAEPTTIEAMVMNLSRGGLGMGIQRTDMGPVTLTNGDRFTILALRIPHRQVRQHLETAAQIRWYVDADTTDLVCLGCAFQAPGADLNQRLTRFVETNFVHLILA